jgi:hypothetical protein
MVEAIVSSAPKIFFEDWVAASSMDKAKEFTCRIKKTKFVSKD